MIGFLSRIRFFPANRGKASFMARLIAMDATFRERRRLREMDDHRLNDIGLSEHDAMLESQKPVWNVPHHWMR